MKAAEMAISNPLIDDYAKGAKGLLVNITGGKDLKLFEVDEAVNKVERKLILSRTNHRRNHRSRT